MGDLQNLYWIWLGAWMRPWMQTLQMLLPPPECKVIKFPVARRSGSR